MPEYDRTKAQDSGFAQVREVLQKFKGVVTDTQEGMWPPAEGRKQKEFLEINMVNNTVLESTEPLSMDISEKYQIRINCSNFKGSFWMDMFLPSAEAHKLVLPDGLKGKLVTFEKQTLENEKPEYNKTDWVVAGIEDAPATPQPATTPAAPDPKALIAELAIGRTDAELQAAIDTDPRLAGSQVLPLAKSGMLTQALIKEGKLVLVDNKYQKA